VFTFEQTGKGFSKMHFKNKDNLEQVITCGPCFSKNNSLFKEHKNVGLEQIASSVEFRD